MDNYEQDLQLLKEQQKKKAISDLEAQQKQSLSNLDAELNTVKPTYYAKKDSANVQSQIAGKNFAEYLANSGKSNSGIGAQYEMLRGNNLQRSLNDLNTSEASTIADINRRKTDVNNAYQSGLTSANAQIEADYITNLLNQRQLAWERNQQEKQFEYQKQQDAIANAQAWAKINSSNSSFPNFDDYVGEENTENNTNNSNIGALIGTVGATLAKQIGGQSQSSSANQLKAVSTPSQFSTTNARNWYLSNLKGKQLNFSQLDNILTSAYENGIITKEDATKIFKSYGL